MEGGLEAPGGGVLLSRGEGGFCCSKRAGCPWRALHTRRSPRCLTVAAPPTRQLPSLLAPPPRNPVLVNISPSLGCQTRDAPCTIAAPPPPADRRSLMQQHLPEMQKKERKKRGGGRARG